MKTKYIQTDQIRCYDESGKIIPCADSGQDGEYKKTRILWPTLRFEADENTVTDLLTGLMWTKNASLWEFPLSWQEALDDVVQMNTFRTFLFNDWRLPERHELFSLISHVHINPALPKGHPFSDIFSGYYWTATPCARLPKQAWYVHLGGGRVFKGMKHGSYMVWPVRSIEARDNCNNKAGQMGRVKNRFIENRHTLTDQCTGLIWTKNAGITKHPVTWIEALTVVKNLNDHNYYGRNDWRLPNIRELESITDMTVHSPAIAASEIFENIQPFYWSSTTSAYDLRYAWTLYTKDGNIGVGYKSNPEFYIWCVPSNSGD
jgi:Protein of unknown function (DUF1566)